MLPEQFPSGLVRIESKGGQVLETSSADASVLWFEISGWYAQEAGSAVPLLYALLVHGQ